MESPKVDLDADKLEEMRSDLHDRIDEAGIDEGNVLAKARENMIIWDGYFNENVTRGKDDMNFALRDQWTAVERSEFNRLFKPGMTFNRIYPEVKKILGEQRKNKPDLIVRSLTGKSDQKQIDLRADLIRTICYQSQNDLVYQTAFKSALLMGFGAFEICVDYESPNSFNKTIRYDIITDPTRTSFDPTAMKPHKGDGNYCARQYLYTKEEFYATFPHVDNATSFSDPRSLLDFQWETRDTIVVCKYTQKEWFPLHIFRLSNGMTVTEAEWEDMQEQIELVKNLAKESVVLKDVILKEIPTIKAERHSQDYKIRQYLMTQNQIIDFEDWKSRQLPIIFMDGDSNYIEGRQNTRSFIHEAKDAQKFVNYTGSEIAAEIKNRRREQWIGTPDNIQGYEQMWRNPELQNGILIAKPDPKTGQMPQKMAAWDISQGLLMQMQRGCQDIKEILGISENSDMQGKDISGKARRERKLETSMSSYVFFDNANQAIEQSGRVVLELLPHIVGEDERHMTIAKPDGRTESIIMNYKSGGNVENQLDKSEYDIEIDTGPSFAVQKDIALEFFQQTISANPQVFPLIADLWASQLDLQQMPIIKERLKTMVPPDVIAKEEGKPIPPPPPNPQEEMMKAEIQEKQQSIAIKQAELQLKQQQLQLDKEELELKAQKMGMDYQLDVFNHKADIERSRLDHSLKRNIAQADHNTDVTKILADLHKHHTQAKKESES